MSDSLLAAKAAEHEEQHDEVESGTPERDTPKRPEGQKLKRNEAPKADADEKKEAVEGEQDEKPKEKQKRAPEAYKFSKPSGLPDDHELDERVITQFGEVARELDLAQEDAQKVVDKIIPVIHRRAVEQQQQLHEEWKAQARADKDIGGTKFDENLGIAKRGLQLHNDPELNQLLAGPLGSHRAIIRLLVRYGKSLSQDGPVGGDRAHGKFDPNDTAGNAKRLYGNR